MAFNYDEIINNNKVYVIAEMSANHSNDINIAKEIIRKAKECGADCVKVQTYTPDTITIDCDNKYFQIKSGLWQNETLYSLYSKAYMPWDWYPELVKTATNLNGDDSFEFKEGGNALYGIAGHGDFPMMFCNGAENRLFTQDGDDYILGIGTERMYNTVEKLVNIFDSKAGYAHFNGNTVMPDGYMNLFRANRAAFLTCELKSTNQLRDMDATFGLLPCPKYELYLDKEEKFRFRLRASNGEIICASQGYTAKQSALEGIASIKENTPRADFVVLD